MFDPDVMSPKLLNAERLERRFASLTRARESIQGLSSWIIRHKEHYQEIVQLWFEGLKKDFNALNMFYVANDVIQHCGKKKAPEYREAFASVLEKAVRIEKVKEIRNEVTRMITLWQDRELFDDNLFERLKNALATPAVEEPEVEEVEASEADIIANFKLENLINSLRHLKTLEDELSKKQSFLEDIEEPVITNYENIIVKLESKQEIRKFDRHKKLIEDYLSLSDKVLAAEKSVLKNLKNSSVFYNAQNEDAKTVAHAYRIYAKKIKMVEKSLLEKLLNFPPESPDSSTDGLPSPRLESDVSQTSFIFASPSNSLGVSSKNSNLSPPAPVLDLSDSAAENPKIFSETKLDFNSSDFSLSGNCESTHESNKSETFQKKNNPKDSIISTPETSVGSITPTAATPVTPKSPLPVFFPSKSPLQGIPGLSLNSPQGSCAAYSPSSPKSPISISSICSNSAAQDDWKPAAAKVSSAQDDFKSVAPKVSALPADLKSAPSNVSAVQADLKSVAPQVLAVPEDMKLVPTVSATQDDLKLDASTVPTTQGDMKPAAPIVSLTQADLKPPAPTVPVESEFPVSTKPVNSSYSESPEDIDSLLDKAYHEQMKSRANYKRKIDNLLKLKQAKSCKLDDTKDGEAKENSKTSENEMEISASTSLAQDVAVSKAKEESVSPTNEKKPKEEASSSSECLLKSCPEQITRMKDLELNVPICNKPKQETIDGISTSQTPEVSEVQTASIPGSFGFKSLPDIPTEMLQNILNKYKESLGVNSSASSDKTGAPEVKKELVSTADAPESITIAPKESLKDVASIEKDASCKHKEIKMEENVKSLEKQKKLNALPSTDFLNSLRNMLNSFSMEEKTLEAGETNNIHLSPSIPLENTLKLYSCLMKSYDKVNSVNEQTFGLFRPNLISAVQVNEALCKDETESNKNNTEPAHLSDNLEVMDMEVDSDENE